MNQVHYDYYKQRRKTKLFQIESAISGNSENMYRSLGVNTANMQAINQINLSKKFINEDQPSPESERKLSKLM